MTLRPRPLLLAVALVLVSSCGDGAATEVPRALFVLPRGGDEAFFDLPWPTDLRRTGEGTIDVLDYPVRGDNAIVRSYLEAMTAELDGYGTQSSAYLRFSTDLDPTSLPASGASTLAAGASAFLMDVDPSSPSQGQRHPARVHYQRDATAYWPAHTVAITPFPGFPLEPGRTYAAVVTRGVVASDGAPLARDADLEAVVAGAGDPAVTAALAVYGPALTALAAAGVPTDEVLSLAVFTTQTRGFDEMMAARDWLLSSYVSPSTDEADFTYQGTVDGFDWVEGTYGPSPIFQSGTIPYMEGGGAIAFVGGEPQVVGTFQPRFTLSVPTAPMPASGYPLVIYAHGTGGSYRSSITTGLAASLAAEGIAVLGTDQIHHGDRVPAGTAPDLAVFNIVNPAAFRDNVRQATLDLVQEARLVASLAVPDGLIPGRSGVVFDPARVHYYGHSQGGVNGPLFLAVDDAVDRAVLSGTGALLSVSLVEKTLPFEIAPFALVLLGISGTPEAEGWTLEHPIPCLLQTWMEASDPGNYAPMIVTSPRAGFAPKSVLQTEGLTDGHVPAASLEAFAVAAELPLLEPVLVEIPGLALRGLSPMTAPVSANVASGAATGGLLQFPGDHFVARASPALEQIAGFLASETVPPTLPAAP